MPDRLHFTPEGYRELGKRYGEKMLSLLGYKVAEAKQPEKPGPTPTTYCNPLSLPNYPLGKRARDVTVGAPVPRNDWLWLVDRQQQFRELADVSVLWHEGAWYLYPSVDMAWVSKDKDAARWAKFMGEQLSPEIAKLVGKQLFDPKTKTGEFSCANCLTLKKSK